jgi:hypothetical protein
MLGTIWHGFEILMMAFHGFIWGRFILRRIWTALTVNSEVDIRPEKVSLDVDIKLLPLEAESISGIHDIQRGAINTSSISALFKEAYGDKIMDLVPMSAKAGYLIRNKDGSEEEISMGDLALAVQKPSKNVIIRNLFK